MTIEKNSLGESVRFNKAERHQVEFFRRLCLDELIGEDHTARVLWDYVCSLDLSAFYAPFKAVTGNVGRKPVDPKILLTIWLYATLEGITSARRLAALCKRDAVFMWICGNVGVNRKLLNDFRICHPEALKKVMVETIAILQHNDLIDFQRVSQDGMRLRANAGKGSFRRKETLKELLDQAKKEVEKVFQDDDDDDSSQQQASKRRAAEDRQRRLEAALEEHKTLSEQREKRRKGDGEKTRVSTTDPEARNMKMSDGGYRPALNVQAATLNGSRIIVGIEVTNNGTDSRQMKPMLDQIESDFGERPREILADGGYNSRDDVTEVEQSNTKVYSPVRKTRKAGEDPYARKRGDTDEVACWRERMKTEEAQAIYHERCSTAEFPFARFRNHGLQQSPVRGIQKTKTIALWHALVHNFQQMVCNGWLNTVVQR